MQNTALLVPDCRPAVLTVLPGAGRPLLDRPARAAAAVRERGGTVAHVRTAFTEDGWAAAPAGNSAFAAIARHRALHPEDPATAPDPRPAPRDGDLPARKTRLAAFSTTGLHRQPRARGIDTLILAGLSTGGAVLSAALDAADRGYRLQVLSDVIADPDPELHRAVLGRVLPARAEMLTCALLRPS
ncbi:isochorismatase family protein [Kitasatospora sp. NPDC059646]|uniref:isochorismatase family protein n=1 Tax=Kitasatospora sp. NPDC059646 TaxID=3346893 RepID=UPI0036D0FFD0